MAWPDVATNFTPDFEVTAGSGDLALYYSRWANQDCEGDKLHIVREVIGQGAADDNGTHYLQFDMATGTLTHTARINDANLSNINRFAPVIALNPDDGRLWCVYILKGGTSGAKNAQASIGVVTAKYSDDSGLTWSGEVTLGSTTHSFPSISFGTDGSGFVGAYNHTNGWYDVFEFQGGATWGSETMVFNPSALPINTMNAIAMDNAGGAVMIVDNTTGSSQADAGYIYFNGTSWGGFTRIKEWTHSNAGLTWPHVQWIATESSWIGMVGEYIGTGALERFTISAGGSLTSSDAAAFNIPIGSGFWERSFDCWVDRDGNIHVFNSPSGTGQQYYVWTIADSTWSTVFNAGWTSQVADHGATSNPASTYAGNIGVSQDGEGMIVFSGDDSTVGSADEDFWGAWNEELITLSIIGDVGEVGCIVGLATYEKSDSTRLMAWIGSGLYHDGDSAEFSGNRLAVGSFEQTPDFAVFEDNLLVADGENPLKLWDMVAPAATAITGAPSAVGVEVARNRVWCWEASRPRRLLWSGLRDETNWILDDSATILEGDPGFAVVDELPQGEPITAIKEFFGKRYLFSRSGVAVVTGDTNGVSGLSNGIEGFRISKVQGTIGCEANLTVVDVGTDLIFMSRKGVHSLQNTQKYGDVEQAYLSAPIQDFFTSLDPTLLHRCKATHYRRKNWYVLTVPRLSDGAMKSILIYDYSQQKWSIWDFTYEICSVHARLNPSTLKEELLIGTNRGYVGVADQDSTYDNIVGANYTSKIRSVWLSGDAVRTYKHFVRGIVHLARPANEDITGTYQVDAGEARSFTIGQNPDGAVSIGSFVIGTNKIGEGGGSTPVHCDFLIHERGRSIRVELETPTGPSTISGLELEITPGSYRSDTRK